MSDAKPGYNGPPKEKVFDAIGRLLEQRFAQMRAMAKQAAIYAAFEAIGGDPKDLKDGVEYSRMSFEEMVAGAQRQVRNWGWRGIPIDADDGGQFSFAAALSEVVPSQEGSGVYPLGSAPSLGMAKIDGYQCGKRGSLALADNPWPATSEEAGLWAQGFGEGMEDRKPEKPSKVELGEDGQPVRKRGRGRPRKTAVDEMAERAASMPGNGRDEPSDDDRAGWRADRDFSDSDIPTAIN